jgi:hypothetical protein
MQGYSQVPEGSIGPVERELNTYGHNGER